MYRGRVSSGRGGGFTNRGGGYVGQRGRSRYNVGPKRDLEEELLMLIHSEFLINCSEVRPFDEVFDRVRRNEELYGYVFNSEQCFRDFIASYKNLFYFDPTNPSMLRWTKERIISKRDPKAHIRQVRRDWEKNFDETVIPYDINMEENILVLIVALFDIAQDIFVNTDLIEKTVKLALQNEVTMMDYVGPTVRAFMMRRDHIFREHLDDIQFFGKNAYLVLQLINTFVRNQVSGQNRDTMAHVHDFCLQHAKITPQIREELRLDDRKDFVNFVTRCKYLLCCTDTHITSKIDMPQLVIDYRRLNYCKQVLKDFRTMIHKKDSDEEEEPRGSTRPIFGFDSNGQQIWLNRPVASTSSAGSVTSSSAIVENPFQRCQNQELARSMQSLTVSVRRGNSNNNQQLANVILRGPVDF